MGFVKTEETREVEGGREEREMKEGLREEALVKLDVNALFDQGPCDKGREKVHRCGLYRRIVKQTLYIHK